MARKLRVEYAGAIYHVMNRGDRRELIFMAETTMTVGWIAERLAMGTRSYLNHLLYRRRKQGGE